MTHFPGRNQIDFSERWERDIDRDLADILQFDASAVVTLVEEKEFELLGVPDLPARVLEYGMAWYHLPIIDRDVPREPFHRAWRENGPDILQTLRRGKTLVVHCAAGLGRTGLFAAKLLVNLGIEPADAVLAVRAARRGAIETPAQESYVLGGPSL